ncbi:MAG: DPP IV N-terminal domain-containing protein [Pirellulaceae bacterium]|nr:DPP IV N-terminal domain-containing protein [Pirellulaceae bacterium]
MSRITAIIFCLLWSIVGGFGGTSWGQSDLRIEQLPGYEAYQEAQRNRGRNLRMLRVDWSKDGTFANVRLGDFERSVDLKTFELAEKRAGEFIEADQPQRRSPQRSAVARAEQRTIEPSPDGKWNAVFRDNNITLEPIPAERETPVQVTTDGIDRLRYGTGCWVYGEELDQKEAMWWSPDSTKLVFYEVDEQGLKDYHLTFDNTDLYTTLHTTRYPKAGETNPQVNLMVYDLATKKVNRFSIDGEPRQYLFNIKFAPNGRELIVSRTNRRQNVLDVLAIDVESGDMRVVVTERQPTWQTNRPTMQFLEDGERFIWETEANGWKNYQLRHFDGGLLQDLTNWNQFPCERIVRVDEANGWFYYTAYSDSFPYNEQLHRVRLNGESEQRISTSAWHHSNFEIDPHGRFVMATRQQIDQAPEHVIYSIGGEEVAVLHDPDAPQIDVHSEIFSFTASDGKTPIYGILHKPADFDPAKKYPLLIDVYGGPNSRGLSSQFSPTNAMTAFGFLVAKVGNRGTVGRGKAFESATYLQLGILDLDDQADAVKHLSERPYVDGGRVGIYGHSYGGYMSALALLRYPDVFHVGVAGAPVTDWKHYDTIYTERYMRTPQENPDGYRIGSCLEYTKNLQGKLFLVHGLIDDNVHPSNTWELAKKLNDENKRFDMMIYPEFKHGIGSTYSALRVEYLYRHLMAQPAVPSQIIGE